MKEAFISLLKVKSIVSIAITGLVVYLGVIGTLAPDKVFELALIIFGFYFGTQHEKKQEADSTVAEIATTEEFEVDNNAN